jgi:hypothetical protein
MKRLPLLLVIFSFLIVFAVVFLLLMSRFLTLERKIKAEVLVVEGWIPYIALHTAYDEFKTGVYDKIILTGNTISDDLTLHVNSFLIFYPRMEMTPDTNYVFELDVQSSLGVSDSAHFVLWVNDQPLADWYTPENAGVFSKEFIIFSEMDSLMIQYKNDTFSEKGDRNLLVREFKVNGHNLLDNTTHRVIDRGRPFGQHRWNLKESSYAEFAARYFQDREIDNSSIIPVTNYLDVRRRTYGNALALRQWFDEQQYYPEAINIVSINYHSRRTWMIYNALLGDKMDVGIISVPSVQKELTWQTRYTYIIRESVALLYYLLFVMPGV